MGNFSVIKKSVDQVELEGKIYTCNGERIFIDGQSRWLYRTKKGLDCDILVCDDRYLEEPEFTHLTKLPGGCYTVPSSGTAPDYLTFTAQEANSTIALNKQGEGADVVLEYSIDGGLTWLSYTIGEAITLPLVGDSVKFRGENQTFSSEKTYFYFEMTGLIAASGNIMTLLSVNGQADLPKYAFRRLFTSNEALTQAPALPATTLAENCYAEMFNYCTSLTQAPALPATTLYPNCYYKMFYECNSLTQAPTLPATTLAENCYAEMFYDCNSLTQAPALPATTLAEACYYAMFNGCTSLTQAPALPATMLADYCYHSMFIVCTSLIQAPVLPATTLAENCYSEMFYNCLSLSYVEALFTTTPGSEYTNNWLSGVAQTGTFVKSANATWNVTGASGVPEGWTVTTK